MRKNYLLVRTQWEAGKTSSLLVIWLQVRHTRRRDGSPYLHERRIDVISIIHPELGKVVKIHNQHHLNKNSILQLAFAQGEVLFR